VSGSFVWVICLSGHLNEDRPPSKRARKVEQLPPSHLLHKLWLLREQTDTKSFIVQRKSEDSDINAPSTGWIMTRQDVINHLLGFENGHLLGVLIREEYTEAFRAVVEFSQTRRAKRRTEVTDDETEESHQSKTGAQDFYLNPFSNISATLSVSKGGFILIGHPGIGKTVWLIVMLILRLQAGLATIYQSKVDYIYVFNDEGVFKFYCGPKGDPDWYEIERHTTLPSTMWALIDSNQNLIEVPLAYHG